MSKSFCNIKGEAMETEKQHFRIVNLQKRMYNKDGTYEDTEMDGQLALEVSLLLDVPF